MKRLLKIIALVTAFACAFALFSACSSDKEKNEPVTNAGMYYDRNGEESSSREEVKYYDKDGNVYLFEMVEDYLPDYVNQQTGERLNGFNCYITEDGYLYNDISNKLNLVSGTTDTYSDSDSNTYYDISTVYWDMNGNMFHRAVK